MSGHAARPLHRRQLLCAGGALPLLAGRLSSAPPAGKRLFRFLQWNDQHVDATQPPAYARANEKQEYLTSTVRQFSPSRRPAFILSAGDMIHGEDLPSIRADFQVFRRLTANLGVPFYPDVGNHEVKQNEGDPQWQQPYIDQFGAARLNYTFEHSGLLFVVFNNSGAPAANSRTNRDDWVRGILEANRDKPKILCCHIPLVPIREDRVLRKSFGFSSYQAHDERLLATIEEHADTVIAVLAGHLHLTGTVLRNGIYHIVPSGTASYPCDYAGYDVFPDRIAVRMIPIPARLQTRETDIHGRPRYKMDYTGRDHPTHELYLKGNPAERAFDIPLAGKKRLA